MSLKNPMSLIFRKYYESTSLEFRKSFESMGLEFQKSHESDRILRVRTYNQLQIL
jgi:hypothetical protein